MDEKLALVHEHRHRYGLNACLKAVGVSKSTWHYRQHRRSQAEKDAPLKARIIAIIEQHAAYGYRRILEELAQADMPPVNHKRLRRVLNTYELGLRRCLPTTKPSAVQQLLGAVGSAKNLVKGRSFGMLEAFSTDFTEILYAAGRKKAWLMTLVCIESRWAGGWAVGPSRNRAVAMVTLDRLKERLQAMGRSLEGVILHHDQDSVFTSHAWVWRVLIEERAQLSYTENGAKDNPWIESFWGRFKTENRDLLWEAETLEEVSAIIDDKMPYYNGARRHSALAYKPPEEVLSAIINPENVACSVSLG